MSEKQTIKKDILSRVRWLYVIFSLLGIAIMGQIMWLQWGPSSRKLIDDARTIGYRQDTIPADRGDILARDGRILAVSVPMYHVFVDFTVIKDSVFRSNVGGLAQSMSSFFKDKSKDAYEKMLRESYTVRKTYKVVTPRRVDYLELKEIRKFPIFNLGRFKGGMIPEPVNQRVYPHGSLARRTIGNVNIEGQGCGIELQFDEKLRGQGGRAMKLRVTSDFSMYIPDQENLEPINGVDILTTIDVDLQDVAENALKETLENRNAEWGTAIVMEVATGEIRAIANVHRTGPGKFREDNNYAISEIPEPGSTFKIATLMALLEDGMPLEARYNTNQKRPEIYGLGDVKDSHDCGICDLKGLLEQSSNRGFVMAVYDRFHDDPSRFVDRICAMGFDKPLGMQIPDEARPRVTRPGSSSWSKLSLTKLPYGYALGVTPMHTLMLTNAIANGGKMMRPMIVKELQQMGVCVTPYSPEVVNPQICSEKTLRQIQESMRGVVVNGTARSIFKDSHVKIAAKTGTAQMYRDSMGVYRDRNGVLRKLKGYVDRNQGRYYFGSLVGYFPADNPKYSCFVGVKVYNSPSSPNKYYGAEIAGPAFRAIANRAYGSGVEWQKAIEGNKTNRTMPPVKGGNLAEVRAVAAELSLPAHIMRSDRGWGQLGADSSQIEVLQTIVEDGTVPNVMGMGLKDAIYLMERSGLKVVFAGRGKVVAQSLEAGAPAVRGTVVTLSLGL